ncbi:MAG: alpha-ketoglutarate-dependent dioxygenase AlkB [Gammaproteobacteria bacterium]|nr:alpha-ketoglutarate-dependent dioxygenase AlkB [Gammaproteobacteria bacterium]
MHTASIRKIVDHDGEAIVIDPFLEDAEQRASYRTLVDELAWEDESIRIFGKTVTVPRYVAWYGRARPAGTGSGMGHELHPLPPVLQQLKQRVELASGKDFDSIQANYYRNGSDSTGWRSESAASEQRADIAALNLGAPRLFSFAHASSKEHREIMLRGGSLLVMDGLSQRCWYRCMPRVLSIDEGRITLVFRLLGKG